MGKKRKRRRTKNWFHRNVKYIVLIGAAAVAAALVVGALSRPIPTVADSALNTPSSQEPVESAVPATAFQAHVATLDGAVSIAALGSSLTAGNGASEFGQTWGYKLEQTLGKNFTVTPLGYPGHTIATIREDGGVQAVIDAAPDVVFLEPGTPNNFGQGISIENSKALTTETIAEIRAALPGAFIVGIVPSPIANLDADSSGRTYADYIAGDRESLATADLVCDVFSSFTDVDAQLKDGIHPNDVGNTIWADAVNACLNG